MSVKKIKINVFMEDAEDKPIQYVADQRDFAEFEAQDFGISYFDVLAGRKVIKFLRFVSWHAGTRQGSIKIPWDEWNAKCVQATQVSEKEGAKAADDSDTPGEAVQ